ncbi:hypothetical protein BO99DRAFT_150437 [Aspergillus violaceofuscus CBS 115571]|uniref:Uncharacterized protein n=1 Tax=Aspergillus violaceofuscus (strain CBS 115571) TaxID=1450538 RepID=A0A2V5I4B4_ASPV1|nr:hypothetical protein BO99DRAFT_150437 [Aspergillus violaceofuscus CBS 115571]
MPLPRPSPNIPTSTSNPTSHNQETQPSQTNVTPRPRDPLLARPHHQPPAPARRLRAARHRAASPVGHGHGPDTPRRLQTFVAFLRGRPFFWFIHGPSTDPGWCITKLLLFWRSALADPNYRIPAAMMLAGGGCLGGNQVMFWTFEARGSHADADADADADAGGGGAGHGQAHRVPTQWQRQGRTQFDWWADEFLTTRFFSHVAENMNAVVWPSPPLGASQDTEGEGEGEGESETATTASREGTPRPLEPIAGDADGHSFTDPDGGSWLC